jgi:hypothetical protein
MNGNYVREGLGVDLVFTRTVQPTTVLAPIAVQPSTGVRYEAVVDPAVSTGRITRTVAPTPAPLPAVLPSIAPTATRTVTATIPTPATVLDPARTAAVYAQPVARPMLTQSEISVLQPTAPIVARAETTTRYVEQPPTEAAPIDPVLAVKPPRVASATGTNYEPEPPSILPAADPDRQVKYSREPATASYEQASTPELDQAFEQQGYQTQQGKTVQQLEKATIAAEKPASSNTAVIAAVGVAALALMLFGGKGAGGPV